MLNAQNMLKDREISRFIAKNENATDRIKRAAALLKDQPDGTAALRKVLPSLAAQEIKVFFSYKQKDERTAKTIVKVLREAAAGRLQITYQADFAKQIAGKPWRDKISRDVRDANWFILLLPDPSEELDWCLFETGLFEAQLTSADRLLCLHHPDTAVPSPIEGYHAIAATLPEVEKFLQMVFIEENPIVGMPAINPQIQDRLPDLARSIVDAIRIPKSRTNRVVFEPWIELRIDEATKLQSKEQLDSALVVSANKEALDMFGLIDCKSTFAELRAGVEERAEDGRWRSELFHVIRKISSGRKFFPIQAVFQSHTGRMYRPVALAIDRAGSAGPIQTYHITFAEEVTTADTAAMPGRLALLATLLRFTFRFRWEVLELFTRRPLNADDISRLDISLRRIKVDWQSRGNVDEKNILELFEGEQSTRVEAIFKASHELRNNEGTGQLDIAIDKRDGDLIPKILASFLPLNQSFLEIAADRFSEMIAEFSGPLAMPSSDRSRRTERSN